LQIHADLRIIVATIKILSTLIQIDAKTFIYGS